MGQRHVLGEVALPLDDWFIDKCTGKERSFGYGQPGNKVSLSFNFLFHQLTLTVLQPITLKVSLGGSCLSTCFSSYRRQTSLGISMIHVAKHRHMLVLLSLPIPQLVRQALGTKKGVRIAETTPSPLLSARPPADYRRCQYRPVMHGQPQANHRRHLLRCHPRLNPWILTLLHLHIKPMMLRWTPNLHSG